MIRLLLALPLALAAAEPVALDGPFGDLGDGTFRNPVMVGTLGDIAHCKVGDDHYATHGKTLDIWHSRDLVNWKKIAELDSAGRGDIWAPDIVHVGGKYYVYTTFVDRSKPSGEQFVNVVFHADKPDGPWSEPVDLKLNGMIDPEVENDDADLNLWLGILALSLVLGIGLSWSHVRRHLAGQHDVDDIDD